MPVVGLVTVRTGCSGGWLAAADGAAEPAVTMAPITSVKSVAKRAMDPRRVVVMQTVKHAAVTEKQQNRPGVGVLSEQLFGGQRVENVGVRRDRREQAHRGRQ